MARGDGQVQVQLSADGTQLTIGLQQAGEAIRRFGRTVSGQAGSFASLDAAAVATGARLVKIAEGLQAVGQKMQEFSRSVAQGFGAAISVGAEYEKQMRNVNSIAKESEGQFQQTSDAVLKMSSRLGLTEGPGKMAAALYDINSSGFKGAEGLKILEASTKAASAGLTDTKTAAGVIVGSLNAYGRGAQDAGRFADILFKTVDAGTISFEELSQNLGQVTATSANFGVSFEEMNAAIAVMTNRGIKAPEAITALNAMILQLGAPTEEAKKAMAQYGLHIDATTLRAKGLRNTLLEAFTKTGANPEALRKILGEANAVKGGLSLMSDKGKSFGETTSDTVNSSGATDKALSEQRKALSFQWDALKAQLEVAGIGIAKVMMPYAKQVVATVREIVDAFQSLPDGTKSLVVTIAAAAGAFSALAGTLLVFAPSLAAIYTLVTAGPIAAALAGIGGAIGSIALPVGVAVAALAALYAAWQNDWGGIQEVTYDVAGKVWTFLKEGFEYLRTEVPRIWNETWQTVRFAFTRMWIEIRPGVLEFQDFLIDAWDNIKGPMTSVARTTIPALKVAFEVLSKAVFAVGVVLKEEFLIVWEVIKGVVSTVWPLISGIIMGALDLISAAVTAFLQLLQGDWKGAWESLKSAMSDAFGRILPALKQALGNLAESLKSIGSQFVIAGESMIDALIRGIANRKDPLMSAVKALKAEMDEAMNETRGFAKDSSGNVIDVKPGNVGTTTGTGTIPAPPYQKQGFWFSRFTAPEALGPPPVPIVAKKPDFAPVTPHPVAKPKKANDKSDLEILLALQQRDTTGASISGRFSDWRRASADRAVAGIHGGYDIAMPAGSPVAAGWSGRVVRNTPWGGGGYGTTIELPDKRTVTYGHIIPALREGATISQGDRVGSVLRDHVDVKMKDPSGKYIDFSKLREKPGQGRGSLVESQGKAVRDFLALKPDGQQSELSSKRSQLEDRYYSARSGATTPEQQAAVESQHKRLMERLNTEELRQSQDLQSRLIKMRAESGDTQEAQVTLELANLTDRYRGFYRDLNDRALQDPSQSGEIEKTRAALQQAELRETGLLEIKRKYIPQIRDLEDQERMHPEQTLELERQKTNLLISEARERTKMLIQLDGEKSESARKSMAEEMTLRDQGLQLSLKTIQQKRSMSQLSAQEEMQQIGDLLNSFQGSYESRAALMAQYKELVIQHYQEQQTLYGDWSLQDLQRAQDNLMVFDQSVTTSQVQLGVIQDMIRAQRITKLQQERQQVIQVAQSVSQGFEQFLGSVMGGQTKFADAFKSLWQSITQTVIKYVGEMIIKVLALQKLMQAAFSFFGFGIGGAASSVGGSLGGGFGDLISGGLTAFHTGGLVVPGGIQVLHSGGFAGYDIRPDEVMAKLQVGEMVLSRSQVEEARRAGATRSEQPGVYAPSLTIETVYIREEADIDRLATAIAQRQREDWQAWR